MTSRERVLAALDHRQPDRVPLDFSGHRSSGIAAIAYPKLRAVLGLPPRPVRVYDPVQQLAVVDEDMLELLGVDTIELGRGFALDDGDWAEWTLPDGQTCLMPRWALPRRVEGAWVLDSPSGRVLAAMPDGALFFDQVYWPFLESEDLAALPGLFAESMWTGIAAPPGPLAPTPEALAAGARQLRERSSRAVLGLFGGNLFEMGQFLYRMDQFLMMLGEAPARVHRFLDRIMEIHLANLERFLGAVGPYIDIIVFGDDLGGQQAPLLSPRMYREFFAPRHALLWRRARELAPVQVMLHCCGAIRPLLPLLIEAGLDAVNPVQIAGRGMEAAGLKRDFGAAITFWGGGCDTQRLLPMATPDEVRAHVREQVAALSPGGGFVFQQVHNILANVPVENTLAMFAAVRPLERA
jgi:uroporphyrinogen decarboxylase